MMNWVKILFGVCCWFSMPEEGSITATKLTRLGYSRSLISAVLLHSVCAWCAHRDSQLTKTKTCLVLELIESTLPDNLPHWGTGVSRRG